MQTQTRRSGIAIKTQTSSKMEGDFELLLKFPAGRAIARTSLENVFLPAKQPHLADP
jgi:uncharacterized protein VirK/YbjX